MTASFSAKCFAVLGPSLVQLIKLLYLSISSFWVFWLLLLLSVYLPKFSFILCLHISSFLAFSNQTDASILTNPLFHSVSLSLSYVCYHVFVSLNSRFIVSFLSSLLCASFCLYLCFTVSNNNNVWRRLLLALPIHSQRLRKNSCLITTHIQHLEIITDPKLQFYSGN